MRFNYILTATISLASMLVGCSTSNSNTSAISLNGAGATFPNPIYQRWFADFSTKTGNRVNYQSVGSGAGVKQFIAGTVDFAATDEPIKAEDAIKVKQGVVQIPLTAGTIAVAYNNPKCSLKLTQKQLVGVFDGTIKNWSELGCPQGNIVAVHRADGSGTTAVFTRSLSAFSNDWANRFGHAKSVNFPVGVASKGNEGVAGTIKTTPGSIGYVNFSYAKGARLQVALVQNKFGNFIYPDAESGSEALANLSLDPATLAGESPNPEGAKAYPITTLTWILAYKNGDKTNSKVIRSLLEYSLSEEAQQKAVGMGYVPLSESIIGKATKAVSQIN